MTRLLVLPAALSVLAISAFAQELPGESLGLIPEAPKPTVKPKAEATAPAEPKKKSSTEKESDDLQMRIRYREAKTRALQDPMLQQEWDRAAAAKTEESKREALKSYYKLLCDRMVKIDAAVKPRVEIFQKSLAWRLNPNARLGSKTLTPTDERDEEERATQIR